MTSVWGAKINLALQAWKTLLIPDGLWNITGSCAITLLKSVRKVPEIEDGVRSPYRVTGFAAFKQGLQIFLQLSEGEIFTYLFLKKIISLIHLEFEKYFAGGEWPQEETKRFLELLRLGGKGKS
jgi:hypothetical protein